MDELLEVLSVAERRRYDSQLGELLEQARQVDPLRQIPREALNDMAVEMLDAEDEVLAMHVLKTIVEER